MDHDKKIDDFLLVVIYFPLLCQKTTAEKNENFPTGCSISQL